jgi:GT2 family glycosyltransferase
VLLTTYNGAAFIGEAIASLLAQTFRDFEVIVVDDASTDDTPRILANLADPRIRVIRRTTNGGIVAARNHGFAAARGAYVAALDHDDLSRPERLACQVAYLDQHRSVVLLATEIEIAEAGRRHRPDHTYGGAPNIIRWLLYIDNPLTWSSVMFRADAVRRIGAFMRPEAELADDFDLYHRLLAVGEIARLEQSLTIYRVHPGNTSTGHAALLNANAATVLRSAYAPLLGTRAEAAAALVIRHLSERRPVHDLATLGQLGTLLQDLLGSFCRVYQAGAADHATLAQITARTWWRTVRAAVRAGAPRALFVYRRPKDLAEAFRPARRDVATSVAIGCLRSLKRREASPCP